MRLLLALLLCAQPVFAAPKVVADIAPVHSLVAMVMGDLGNPDLMIAKTMDPHSGALRPSQAKALQNADVVISIGAGLTGWLDRAIANLAPSASRLVLMDLPASTRLEARETADFGDHDHDHHDHDHAGEAVDPHGWLDPENAQIWVMAMAEQLATLDPDNAQTYRENASVAADQIKTLASDLAIQLQPAQDKPFVVLHDAFAYFEARFGLNARAAVTLSDAASPGPAWLRDLQGIAQDQELVCFFFAEGENADVLKLLQSSSAQAKIAVLDPLGAVLELGPELYPDLLRRLGSAFSTCLGDK